MTLRSGQFRNNPRLQSALVNDSSHITQGSKGEHVRLIQQVLVRLGERSIAGREYADALYGPTTAAAVLRFKTQRQIINVSYQRTPDDIVGKMTISALDNEALRLETTPRI